MRKASYHPVMAFDPVCLLVESPAVFVVNRRRPISLFNDLLDAARSKPGEMSMAAVGPGSSFQIGFINLTREAKVNMTFVPFQGSAPAVTALLGQHVTSAFAGYAVVSEQMKGGQLRALAAGTSKRTDLLPDVPTFNELGFTNLEVDNWLGVNTPAHTPKEYAGPIDRLVQDRDKRSRGQGQSRIAGALRGRDVRRRLWRTHS